MKLGDTSLKSEAEKLSNTLSVYLVEGVLHLIVGLFFLLEVGSVLIRLGILLTLIIGVRNLSNKSGLQESFLNFDLRIVALLGLTWAIISGLAVEMLMFEEVTPPLDLSRETLKIVWIGSLSFRLGAQFLAKHLHGLLSSKFMVTKLNLSSNSNSRFTYILFAFISLASGLYLYSKSRFLYLTDNLQALQSSTQLISIANFFFLFHLAAIWLCANRFASYRKRTDLAMLFVLTLFFAIIGFIGGMRESTLMPIIAGALGYLSVKTTKGNGWSGSKVTAILLCILALMFSTPVMNSYRNEIRSGVSQEQYSDTLVRSIASVESNEVISRESLYAVLNRFNAVQYVEVIVRGKESVGELGVREFFSRQFSLLIPRFVWPEKPIYAIGREIATLYRGLPSSIFTSDGATPIADTWRFGGVMLMAPCMFVLGILISAISQRTGSREVPFLGLFLFFNIFIWDSTFLELFAGIVQFSIFFAIVSSFGIFTKSLSRAGLR